MKTGDIVWVNLGISYGWWPGLFCEKEARKGDPVIEVQESKMETTAEPSSKKTATNGNGHAKCFGQVRFFDDDKYDLYNLSSQDQVQPYSCESKKDYILKGLAKFSSEKKKSSMFDYRARQAQFYKDVEMAEVMTDNDPGVADILGQYEVLEEGDVADKKEQKKSRKRKK